MRDVFLTESSGVIPLAILAGTEIKKSKESIRVFFIKYFERVQDLQIYIL